MSVTMPFFPYYGSKWRAWRHYPPPVHAKIIEPFAGAANYSARYAHLDVELYDANPVIAGLWDYLIHVSESEIRLLPLVGNDDSVFDFDIPEEARWLIGFWIQQGSSRPPQRPSSWFKGGERADRHWGVVVRERLALQLKYIRHWRVTLGDYTDAENEEATWFIDSPYDGQPGRKYPKSSAHIDYESLAAWSRERQGQTIVCERAGATWLPFRPLAEVYCYGGHKSAEAIWTKGCGLFDQQEAPA